jgi:hypothetical protein
LIDVTRDPATPRTPMARIVIATIVSSRVNPEALPCRRPDGREAERLPPLDLRVLP